MISPIRAIKFANLRLNYQEILQLKALKQNMKYQFPKRVQQQVTYQCNINEEQQALQVPWSMRLRSDKEAYKWEETQARANLLRALQVSITQQSSSETVAETRTEVEKMRNALIKATTYSLRKVTLIKLHSTLPWQVLSPLYSNLNHLLFLLYLPGANASS